ncbi:MAG: hypothetical protein KF838_04375 [Phycisphaeraceae bacterium]|nr:MAG: hypothetical protein KF838_04375 [Phycisphaeraceae bacterium]
MTCSTLVNPASGLSDESVYVDMRLSMLREPLKDSRSIGVQALLDDLYLLADECGKANWDGHGAVPVSPDALANAEAFIRCLRMDLREASLGATSKGWVTIQWGVGPRWTLSIAVTADGWLHWAALFGSERAHGTTPFLGSIPKNLVERIQRACIT